MIKTPQQRKGQVIMQVLGQDQNVAPWHCVVVDMTTVP